MELERMAHAARRRAQTRSRLLVLREEALMKPTSLLAIGLIVMGMLALTYQGLTYTTRDDLVDVGTLREVSGGARSLPLPPVLGGLALLGGALMLMTGRRAP